MAINKLFLLSTLSLAACLDHSDRTEPVESEPADHQLSTADDEAATEARAAFKTVFATSATFRGDSLGGLAGADALCAAAAANVELRGTYKAWISDVATSARDRVTHARVPYKLVDGPRVAKNFDDLLDGLLDHEIDRDERGDAIFDFDPFIGGGVWTGSTSDGQKFPWNPSNPDPTSNPRLDCGGWITPSQGVGIIGLSNEFDGTWSGANGGPTCDQVRHLYCFEQ